jgi:hypothetical protein
MKSKLKHALISKGVIGFTGSACAGKDYLAGLLGARTEGMAEPLYWMTDCLFGLTSEDRGVVGLRETWQTLGQWGKGTVNDRYPITPARGVFCEFVRSYFESRDEDYEAKHDRPLCVDWPSYGFQEGIWIDSMVDRIDHRLLTKKDRLIAVTGLRFPIEIEAFAEKGWPVLHVMASPITLGRRQATQNITDEARRDVSEGLAHRLNSILWDAASPTTPVPDIPDLLEMNDIRGVWGAVWNDPEAPCRNEEFLTPAELLGMLPPMIKD